MTRFFSTLAVLAGTALSGCASFDPVESCRSAIAAQGPLVSGAPSTSLWIADTDVNIAVWNLTTSHEEVQCAHDARKIREIRIADRVVFSNPRR